MSKNLRILWNAPSKREDYDFHLMPPYLKAGNKLFGYVVVPVKQLRP